MYSFGANCSYQGNWHRERRSVCKHGGNLALSGATPGILMVQRKCDILEVSAHDALLNQPVRAVTLDSTLSPLRFLTAEKARTRIQAPLFVLFQAY